MYGSKAKDFWIGNSTDTKPKGGIGSVYWERDTGSLYVSDGDGSWHVFEKYVSSKLRVSSMPYLYDIAEGNVSGHTPWSKIGFRVTSGITEEDIWALGTPYVPPSSAMQLEVYSSSTKDSPDGDGIRSVIIYGLDANGAEQTEILTLDGTTAVPTVRTDWTFINGFRAYETGTSLKADGNIDIRNTNDTPVYSRISVGYTRARNSNYKVPLGKALYITSFHVSVHSATKGVRFTTRGTYDATAGYARTFFLPYTEVAMGNGAFNKPLEIPTYFPAGVRIKVSAIADALGAVCSCSLRGWLEDSTVVAELQGN